MIRRLKIAIALLGVLIVGCVSIADDSGCANGGNSAGVSMFLQDIRIETLNGAKSQVGFFQLRNEGSGELTIPGWPEDRALLVEYPIAELQQYDGGWKPVVPLLGSFTSSGPEKRTIPTGASLQLIARTDFGVPSGVQRLRLVVHTTQGGCVISEPFSVNVK